MIERLLLVVFLAGVYVIAGKDGILGALSALCLFQINHRIRYGYWFE